MKGFVLLFGVVAAVLSVFAATASAGTTFIASIDAFFDVGGTPATIPFSYSYDNGDGTFWDCTGKHIVLSADQSEDVETCTITGDTSGYSVGTVDIAPGDWYSDYFLSLDSTDFVEATSGTITFSVAAAPTLAPPPQANGSFLCSSQYQVDPWAIPPSIAMADAKAYMTLGWWSPFAEKSVKTPTAIGHGYYLHCGGTLSGATFTKTGNMIGADGTNLGANQALVGWPGYYPEATAK